MTTIRRLADLEREEILKAMEVYDAGAGAKKTRVAEALGVSLRTLQNKLHGYGLADRYLRPLRRAERAPRGA